ncbi:hypothetical protein BC938DRAFT_471089 [Jimgerdemannia flammicorona]|uniref:Uncharacterized protein n=1 Tax=Jimgerdemannia flammicorona TaxID=994334 RepID=A0A433R038_9FUNG|nr:hypothetical protein BC938DRAFT_471089 [Jimgerdemannia flammicorona]
MSLNNRKALVDAWKFRIAALVTPLKDVFHGVPRKSAPTESASSATSALAALHAEVAASQDVVGKVMKRPLPSVLRAGRHRNWTGQGLPSWDGRQGSVYYPSFLVPLH